MADMVSVQKDLQKLISERSVAQNGVWFSMGLPAPIIHDGKPVEIDVEGQRYRLFHSNEDGAGFDDVLVLTLEQMRRTDAGEKIREAVQQGNEAVAPQNQGYRQRFEARVDVEIEKRTHAEVKRRIAAEKQIISADDRDKAIDAEISRREALVAQSGGKVYKLYKYSPKDKENIKSEIEDRIKDGNLSLDDEEAIRLQARLDIKGGVSLREIKKEVSKSAVLETQPMAEQWDNKAKTLMTWGARDTVLLGHVTKEDFAKLKNDGVLQVKPIELKPEYDKVAPPPAPPKPEAPKQEAFIEPRDNVIEKMRAAVEANRAASAEAYKAQIKPSGDVVVTGAPPADGEPLVLDGIPKVQEPPVPEGMPTVRDKLSDYNIHVPMQMRDLKTPQGLEDHQQLHVAAEGLFSAMQLSGVLPDDVPMSQIIDQFRGLGPDYAGLLERADTLIQKMGGPDNMHSNPNSTEYQQFAELNTILINAVSAGGGFENGYQAELKQALEAFDKKYEGIASKWPDPQDVATGQGQDRLAEMVDQTMSKIFAMVDDRGNIVNPRNNPAMENPINGDISSLAKYDIQGASGTNLGDFLREKVWHQHYIKASNGDEWTREEKQALRDELNSIVEDRKAALEGQAPASMPGVAPAAPPQP